MVRTQSGDQRGQMQERSASGERSALVERLTIGQLARRSGVAAKTIRYYEAIGLLPPAARGENHYRRYSLADLTLRRG